MALAPLIINHMFDNCKGATWEDLVGHRSGVLTSHKMRPVCGSLLIPLRSGSCRPCFRRRQLAEDSTLELLLDADKEFKVSLDVQQFKPEEIRVTVDENTIIVEGKHEERSDEQGFVSRQFTRKYTIPDHVDKTAVVSRLSSDGILTLQAPRMIKEDEKKIIEVPIIHTNQPAKIQHNTQPAQSQ